MAIQWDRSLAVGVKLIDEQHQELFRRVNALMDAMMKGQGKAEIDRVLAFLGTYVDEHFGAEERLMARHAYPEARGHMVQHAQFVKTLASIKADIDGAGVSSNAIISVNKAVCAWLREHIGSTDKALGRFLETAGVREAAAG